jgi:hypothetical protein
MKDWMYKMHYWAKNKYDSLLIILDVKENEAIAKLAKLYSLMQNYPNPFNSTTRIKYSIPKSITGQHVKLSIYNILGKLITVLVNKEQNGGDYEVSFDATTLSSGEYFYKLQVTDFIKLRKMIYLK